MSLPTRFTGQAVDIKKDWSKQSDFHLHGTCIESGHSSDKPENPITGTVFLDGGSGVFIVEYLAPESSMHI